MADRLTAEELARWRSIAASEGNMESLTLLDEIEASWAECDRWRERCQYLNRGLNEVVIAHDKERDALRTERDHYQKDRDNAVAWADVLSATEQRLERENATLRAEIQEWGKAAMLATAGTVPTPLEGYVEFGGPKKAQEDILEARVVTDGWRDEVNGLRADLAAAVAREAVLAEALLVIQAETDQASVSVQVDRALADPSPAAKRHMERHAALERFWAAWAEADAASEAQLDATIAAVVSGVASKGEGLRRRSQRAASDLLAASRALRALEAPR